MHDGDRLIRVIVAEDSYVVREFLTSILESAPEIDLVAVCSTRKEVEAAIRVEGPDVVVTDIHMPPSGETEGIEVAAALRESDPSIGVVVLSQRAEPDYAVAVLESGAGGRAYLLMERVRDRDELVGAIVAVARGGTVIDPEIVDVLIEAQAVPTRSPLATLTARERELLREIAAGKSNAAIADSLVLTKRAVEKHINSIFSKLGLSEDHDVSRRVKAALMYLTDQDQGRPTASNRE